MPRNPEAGCYVGAAESNRARRLAAYMIPGMPYRFAVASKFLCDGQKTTRLKRAIAAGRATVFSSVVDDMGCTVPRMLQLSTLFYPAWEANRKQFLDRHDKVIEWVLSLGSGKIPWGEVSKQHIFRVEALEMGWLTEIPQQANRNKFVQANIAGPLVQLYLQDCHKDLIRINQLAQRRAC